MIKQTPYVDITKISLDEFSFWFKCPDGMNPNEASQKGLVEIEKELSHSGRNPKHYNILVGDNPNHLTMRAVYNYEAAKGKEPTELEAHRNMKEVRRVINRRVR